MLYKYSSVEGDILRDYCSVAIIVDIVWVCSCMCFCVGERGTVVEAQMLIESQLESQASDLLYLILPI